MLGGVGSKIVGIRSWDVEGILFVDRVGFRFWEGSVGVAQERVLVVEVIRELLINIRKVFVDFGFGKIVVIVLKKLERLVQERKVVLDLGGFFQYLDILDIDRLKVGFQELDCVGCRLVEVCFWEVEEAFISEKVKICFWEVNEGVIGKGLE